MTTAKPNRRAHNFQDIAGRRFGKLVAVRPSGKDAFGNVVWLCQCDCGMQSFPLYGSLSAGRSTSCGCTKGRFTHLSSRTAEYSIWRAMKARCQINLTYIRRGITVCSRWADSFENFIADMGIRPEGGYSIERIDNDRGYEPGNCKWATKAEQVRNTSRNRFLVHDGRRLTLNEWARETGLNSSTISYRLRKGHPIDVALSPVKWKRLKSR